MDRNPEQLQGNLGKSLPTCLLGPDDADAEARSALEKVRCTRTKLGKLNDKLSVSIPNVGPLKAENEPVF